MLYEATRNTYYVVKKTTGNKYYPCKKYSLRCRKQENIYSII